MSTQDLDLYAARLVASMSDDLVEKSLAEMPDSAVGSPMHRALVARSERKS